MSYIPSEAAKSKLWLPLSWQFVRGCAPRLPGWHIPNCPGHGHSHSRAEQLLGSSRPEAGRDTGVSASSRRGGSKGTAWSHSGGLAGSRDLCRLLPGGLQGQQHPHQRAARQFCNSADALFLAVSEGMNPGCSVFYTEFFSKEEKW